MQQRRRDDEYITLSGSSTGSVSDFNRYSVIYRDFGEFEIGVIVDSDNKFMGISEVRMRRDFLSPTQRISTRSTIDVEEYYKE